MKYEHQDMKKIRKFQKVEPLWAEMGRNGPRRAAALYDMIQLKKIG